MKLISKEYNPVRGITTEYYAKQNGDVFIRRVAEAQGLVDANKRHLNNISDWGRKKHVSASQTIGRIPPLLAEQWATEAGVRMFTPEFNALVKRKLNDPDYKYLKTVTGRV